MWMELLFWVDWKLFEDKHCAFKSSQLNSRCIYWPSALYQTWHKCQAWIQRGLRLGLVGETNANIYIPCYEWNNMRFVWIAPSNLEGLCPGNEESRWTPWGKRWPGQALQRDVDAQAVRTAVFTTRALDTACLGEDPGSITLLVGCSWASYYTCLCLNLLSRKI